MQRLTQERTRRAEPPPGLWRRAFKKFWWYLRQVTGDAAYDNYLRHKARHCRAHPGGDGHGAGQAISAQEFYLDQMRRKYSRINRCC
jgi:hypothetical protein